MLIIWQKDFEKKYHLETKGLTANLHFSKKGDKVNIPDEFEDYISKKLSDAINTGLCKIINSKKAKEEKYKVKELKKD